MEIQSKKPVGGTVQGLAAIPAAKEVRREREGTPGAPANPLEERPDYRISLSEASKKAIAEQAGASAQGQPLPTADLSEEEAAGLAYQAAGQLAQSTAGIVNRAIEKAVNLFM